MTIDYSNRRVIIDDFIGGREGLKMIEELKKEHEFELGYIPLDIDIIRKSIIKELKSREYDLMIFVESGGVYFLATQEIIDRAKRALTLPISHHGRPPKHYDFWSYLGKELNNFVLNNKNVIKSSKSIAIVEGDAGWTKDSLYRIQYAKDKIREINPDAKVDLIVGIIERNLRKSFSSTDIIGVVVADHEKLSDAVHNYETEGYSAYPEKKHVITKLLALWGRRKTLPVVLEKQ